MPSAQLPERFTSREVATQLQVHIATVHRWTLRGVRGRKRRSHLIGGRRFVYASDLEEFLNSGPTANEPATQDQRQQLAQQQLASFCDRPGVDGSHHA